MVFFFSIWLSNWSTRWCYFPLDRVIPLKSSNINGLIELGKFTLVELRLRWFETHLPLEWHQLLVCPLSTVNSLRVLTEIISQDAFFFFPCFYFLSQYNWHTVKLALLGVWFCKFWQMNSCVTSTTIKTTLSTPKWFFLLELEGFPQFHETAEISALCFRNYLLGFLFS